MLAENTQTRQKASHSMMQLKKYEETPRIFQVVAVCVYALFKLKLNYTISSQKLS